MDPNDPRKRLLALQQSNPSIRQQAIPKTVQFMGKDVEVKTADTKYFKTGEQARAEMAQQPQKKTFRGLELGPEKKKTVFGKEIGFLPGTRSVKASGDLNATDDDFLSRFDKTSEEARRYYIKDLQAEAERENSRAIAAGELNFDPVASRTLQLLQDKGRFEGNATDFIAGNADRVRGGLARGLFRGVDFVLPGKNTFGLEKLADNLEEAPQYTKKGKLGEQIGSIEKGIIDFKMLTKGAGGAEKAAGSIPGIGNLIENVSKGGKWAQKAASIIKTTVGSAAGTGISSVQTAGRGDEQNLGKDAAIGLAADLGLSGAGSVYSKFKAGKALKKLADSTDESAIIKQILKASPDADQEAVKDAAKLIAGEKDPAVIKAALESVSVKGAASPAGVVDAPGENVTEDINTPAYQRRDPNTAVPTGKTNEQLSLEAKIRQQTGEDDITPAFERRKQPEPVNALTQNQTPTLKDAESNVPRSDTKPFAGSYDDLTKAKVDELITRATNTVRPPNTVRVFQAVGKDGKTSYVFDNVDSLAAFKNATSAEADTFSFKDVDPSTLKPGKAPGVYQIDETAQAVTPTAKVEQALESLPVSSGVNVDTPTVSNIGDTVSQNADSATKGIQSADDIVPDADPDTKKAVQEVLDSLKSAETNYTDVTKVRAAEKASRAAQAEAAYQAAGGGEAGMRAKLGALRGKYSESGFSPIDAAPEAQKAILDDIASSSLRSFEKTNTQNAIRKIWGATDGKPTPSDIKYIRDYFGQEFGDAVEQAVKDSPTSWREKAGQILGLPRSLMASFDLSGTLRQGGILGARFPKQLAAAFKDEVKYFASDDAFKAGMKEIASRDTFESMVNSGLAVDAAKGLTGTEEQFASNLAEKIPGFGRGIKASDRGYSGFLAKLRADVFDSIVAKEAGKGKELSEDALKDIATFINSASGRGDLGQYLEKHSTTLSAALFSPRLWKSRLDQLNPVYYAKLDPTARKYALQSAASFAATASTVLGLAAMAGAQVETDMRSSDFGKIKVGNTRYDIMGGLQQNLVFAWREISGEKKNSETGDVKSLTEGGFGGADRLSIASDMIQNKENPLLAAGQRILKGKDKGGNPINVFSELANLAVPLGISGTVETAQDQGSAPKGIAMNIPNVFGIGVQTYGTTPTKDQGKKVVNGFPEYTGKITDDMVTDKNGKVILDDKGKPTKVKFPEGATKLEREAIIDDKRNASLADQYRRTLSSEDQALLKLSDSQLTEYTKSGKISPQKYKELQSTQQVIKNISGVKVTDGVRSPGSTDFYKTYNGLNKSEQEEYLNAPADEPAKVIAKEVNSKLPKGLKQIEASNKLAKSFAEHEKDLNTNDYSDIELQNKNKSFFSHIYREAQPKHIQDIYKEGGSDDLKYFMENNAVTKEDLNAAIQLDNELYAAGLAGLKFSKKFRSQYGYGTPDKDGEGGSGGSGSTAKTQRAQLMALMPSFKKGAPLPEFSSVARTKTAKKTSIPKSSGNTKKISIKL